MYNTFWDWAGGATIPPEMVCYFSIFHRRLAICPLPPKYAQSNQPLIKRNLFYFLASFKVKYCEFQAWALIFRYHSTWGELYTIGNIFIPFSAMLRTAFVIKISFIKTNRLFHSNTPPRTLLVWAAQHVVCFFLSLPFEYQSAQLLVYLPLAL